MQRTPRVARSVGAGLLACLAGVATPLSGQQRPAALTEFLQHGIGLDSAQLAAVDRGQAVVKVLDTQDKRDVAVFAIVAANVSRDAYVERVRDFQHWLGAPTRTRFGLFSDPPTAADVEAVVIDGRDIADFKNCHPGDCKIKLPATEMQRAREAIDWSAADVQARANAYARQRLVEYVTDYRARGDTAMVVYDDRGNVRASDAFAALLRQSSYVYQYAPSFHEYLASYPHGRPTGVTEVLFWSEDQLPRLRPILSVTHLAVYAPPELSGATVVAGKQIYANHYFEAALELLTAIDRPTAAATPGVYLMLLRRFRFDDMPSGGIINIRGRVVGKLRDQARADLEREKATSEAALAR